MSTLKSSAEDLTLNADGSGNDIKFQSNAVEKASISDAGLLTTSGGASLDGAVTINDSHADVDFRVESDTITHALFVQGSDGNVGIGTDSPVAKANIHKGGTSGVTDTDDALKLSDADGVSLILENTNTTSGNKNLRIRNNAGVLYFERMNDAASSVTSTPMSIAFVDNVINIDGAIAIGGTGTANQLDDYEEGTWTPSVGGNASYTAQSGWYTKVGRLISVQGYMTINVIGTGSTSVITGLPIAATQPQPPSVVFGKRTNLSTSVVDLCGVIPGSGGSQINITGQTAAADNNTEGIACMGNGTILFFSVHYLTA